MSFKNIETTVGSAVATSGTVTFAYPANTSAGSFTSHGHKLWVEKFQRLLSSPSEFTVTFGASDITVTYLGSTTIPAGCRLNAQFNIEGADNGEVVTRLEESEVKRSSLVAMTKVNLGSPDTADANGIVESQDLTSAGVFSVNTTAAAAIAAAALAGTLDVPRNIVAAWTGTAVLTVTGTDEYGNTIVESSASGTSLTGKKAFKTVTNVSTSANITSLTVGTGDVLGLPFFVEDAGEVVREYEDGVQITSPVAAGSKVRVPFQIDQTDLLAGTPISVLCPVAGVITKVTTIVWKAVTTGDSVTMKVNNTSVDGLAVVVADASAAGDVDTDAPTAGHASTAVAVDDELELIPGASFATAGALTGYIEIEPTNQLNGAFVAGVSSAATATTGDVRGTYDPTTACDGSTAFELLLASSEPKYLGVTQYAG